jgi:excisionase family DNA binding protein
MNTDSELVLLTAKQASQRLAISERTLFTLTKSGEIPHVQIGRLVRYDVVDLRAWISNRKVVLRPSDPVDQK